jgi:thiol-disulfide isomerase/thioredoxin
LRNNFFSLLIIGVVVYFSRHQIIALITPRKIPPAIISASQCVGKKQCALVYLAPWCPACNSIIPQLKIMLQNSSKNSDVGMQIIVGRGRASGDNQKKASEIGENVMTDDEAGSYAQSLNITYFPTFLMVDANKKVLAKDQEAMNLMNQAFALSP